MDHQYINQLLVVSAEATIKPTSNTAEPFREWRLENHYLLIPRSEKGDYDSD